MECNARTVEERLSRWLPERLGERTRVIRDGLIGEENEAGEFVLYWMHHAVRGHENPALDVARLVASEMGVPLIVYQGLGGDHPFNNDRHHTFILQGARDASAELESMGVRHVFWLPDDPKVSSPLVPLSRRAALVVTEDFPAPPFPSWTRRLADRAERPVVAVDASCVVPMRLVEGVHERAFRFRNKTKKLFRERADRAYGEIDATVPDAGGIDLGFEPTDLRRLVIPDAVARCAIDHGVAPIAHTRGGSIAGYARWQAFKEKGLTRYHARRNRAEIDRDELAVSRMSPYLHHGHVSPFRLIRETRAALDGPGGDGAEKYIDELWVWRELAHHFAFHRCDELHSTSVLPSWARETLAAHADDPRETLGRETLARARTGDNLWDAAQRSLLAHGELHNNVRMTWGKALLAWHAGAGATLETLIDLNHRYALDGNDPNSYGGLLWCLGALDRPFDQDEPIYGKLRTRSTSVHAERMDLGAYTRMVSRTSWDRPTCVAVIGGGMAGMSAARTLADHNVSVTVFDKGRGPGGRASTRFEGEQTFDHGAQYFTARDPRFRRAVEAWVERGVVARWSPSLATIEKEGDPEAKASGDVRYVGVPGMHAVVRHLAETIGGESEVRFGRLVHRVERRSDGFAVSCDGREKEEAFDAVIVALPAPQASQLLRGATTIEPEIARVRMEPCWAVMLAFDERVPTGFDGLFVNDASSPLSWVSRDSSKPGRPAGERWVLHASPEWSREHIEMAGDEVAKRLTEAFGRALGVDPPAPKLARAHRWRYALGVMGDSPGMLFDRESMLAVAGDWCHGGRIEGAYLSGVAASGRLLGEIVARA